MQIHRSLTFLRKKTKSDMTRVLSKHQIISQGVVTVFSISANSRTKVTWLLRKPVGRRNISRALPPAVTSRLQFATECECTCPSFPEIVLLERWPGARDRDRDIAHSSASCGECTGLAAHTQPDGQPGFAAERFALEIKMVFPGDSKEIVESICIPQKSNRRP